MSPSVPIISPCFPYCLCSSTVEIVSTVEEPFLTTMWLSQPFGAAADSRLLGLSWIENVTVLLESVSALPDIAPCQRLEMYYKVDIKGSITAEANSVVSIDNHSENTR